MKRFGPYTWGNTRNRADRWVGAGVVGALAVVSGLIVAASAGPGSANTKGVASSSGSGSGSSTSITLPPAFSVFSPTIRQSIENQENAAAANRKPPSEMPSVPILTNPSPTPLLGVTKGGQGPFSADDMLATGSALLDTSSGYVSVFAGETGSLNEQYGSGKAVVRVYVDENGFNRGPTETGTFLLGCGPGTATITGISGPESVSIRAPQAARSILT